MGTNNVIFLEVIEWFDESGRELIHTTMRFSFDKKSLAYGINL